MSEYIANLMKDQTVNRLVDKANNTYGIRVLGRGENLFFQENEKALICEINAVDAVIYTKSIKNWEGEKKMSPEERRRVIELIKKYYATVYSPEVKLIPADYG
jgi:hypothetical protein